MPVPVLTVSQIRQWEDATWRTGQSQETVMRRAGQAVARVARQMTQPGDLVLVLAGKGHNGDDAVFAAEYLDRPNQVLRVSDPTAALTDLEALTGAHPAPCLIIDGLFGIGLNRPLEKPWPQLIERINQSSLPVLSVDVPSGLNADTGEPMSEAIRAKATVTLGAVKEGLIRPSAWPFVGRLEVAPEIGLISCPFRSELNFSFEADFASFPPPRAPHGHKGVFGHLAIVAGTLGFHGAAVLASRGAQRAQPGLITLVTSPESYVPVAAQCQAVMVRPWKEPVELPENCTALLAGPGLAANVPEHVQAFVRRIWQEASMPVVLDASALPWLARLGDDAEPWHIQNSKSKVQNARAPLRVVTPHPGEAARLLQTTTSEVQQDRPGALRELSRRFGDCLVVLKGHQTIVGQSEGPLFINSSGNPFLGQGGSGDLLAGYIAGLLAQPAVQTYPLLAIRFAVWRHGAAADRLTATHPNWVVEDLASELGGSMLDRWK